jgi:predicted DNA binding CopG/RHH family protein
MATKKKTTKTTTIPRFKTEAEEAFWWDAHPDFLTEQFEKAAKEGRLQRGIPKSKSVTIRVPVTDLETAQRLAERKGLPYQTYMKMLLHQALEKERLTG